MLNNRTILLISCLLTLIVANYSFATADEDKHENHSSDSHMKNMEMEDDFDFDSAEFVEAAPYQMTSFSTKGFSPAILFTGLLWFVFFYMFKAKLGGN